MKGTHLGEFEELVLLVVCVLSSEAYGVAIKEEIERQSGRRVSISAVHSALHRLEKKEYVQSWVGGATAERGGRRKRFFEPTAAGKAALSRMRQIREQLWQQINDLGLSGAS